MARPNQLTDREQVARLSRHSSDVAVAATVVNCMPVAFERGLTRGQEEQLRDIIWLVWKQAMSIGAEKATFEHRAKTEREIDALATARAKDSLKWLLENFENLEVME